MLWQHVFNFLGLTLLLVSCKMFLSKVVGCYVRFPNNLLDVGWILSVIFLGAWLLWSFWWEPVRKLWTVRTYNFLVVVLLLELGTIKAQLTPGRFFEGMRSCYSYQDVLFLAKFSFSRRKICVLFGTNSLFWWAVLYISFTSVSIFFCNIMYVWRVLLWHSGANVSIFLMEEGE